MAQSASLLKTIASAPDLDQAVAASLPYIDDLFLGILQANLKAAGERGDAQSLQRFQDVEAAIQRALQEAMPPGLQLADQVLRADDPQQARQLLEASATEIDEQTLGALLSAAQRLEQANEAEQSAELRDLHRLAFRLSMQSRLAGDSSSGPAPSS